jgi:replication factor A1
MLKFESFVNVIGLIENVGQLSSLERPGKTTVALRKFKLIDQSKTVVSVTLWGKQATEFSLATGEILLLRRAKMTNYGGLSLSIMRATEVNVLPENYGDSEVVELRKWWKETWWKSRKQEDYVSINSLLQKDKLKSFMF